MSTKKMKVYDVEDTSKEEVKIEKNKSNGSGLMNCSLIIVLLSSLAYLIMKLFYGTGDEAILSMVGSFLLLIFTSIFVCIGFTIGKRKKLLFALSSVLLIIYFGFSIYTDCFINGGNRVLNFTGMSLTDVIEWSESNKVELIQDYEYSDMINEYHIISQDVLAGTPVKDVKNLTVAISEGPNPAKEVNVPSMIGWSSEKVLEWINKNHLSNVSVEFIIDAGLKDTVIEQDKVGTLKRNDNIKLVFSAGEAIDEEEVKLIDFSGKSKFETEFYLKQHFIKYRIEYGFSKDVKKGLVFKQSVKAGTKVKVNSDEVVITISKGPEIKIVELRGMSLSEVTDWVIKNKLKLEFDDAYDDSIKENHVISCNYKIGDVVEEGTVIKVIISKGKLVMQSFNDINEFRMWAQKYNIQYNEVQEFNSEVPQGGIIRFSHKEGDTIKNGDTITVTISNGEKITVPNVVGLTKDAATSKLKSAGLGYNFVYSYSSTTKGQAIKQSISAGSGVAKGTTVTVTLSNGPKPQTPTTGGGSAPAPTCDTSKGATFWAGVGNTGAQVLSATKGQNPGFNVVATFVKSCPNGATTSGMVCSMNVTEGSWVSYCTTIRMTIVE